MGWDQSRFDGVIRDYLKVTSRTVPQALNTKAFFVCRRALYYTDKASRADMVSRLNRTVTLTTPTGALKHAPLAALMVNKRAKPGEGLWGDAMRTAVRELIMARQRSIAYLKSGWIPAIRDLQRLAFKGESLPPNDSAAVQVGQRKGGSTPATESFATSTAKVWNSAQARHTRKPDALARIGGRGLQRGFEDEAASMEEYMEKKLRVDAAKAQLMLDA